MIELSPRERDVLQMMWDGLTYAEIAKCLSVTKHYIEQIRGRIGLKLQVKAYRNREYTSNIQVIRKALEKGLIQL
ncbi:MAG: hypothetical protein KGP14_07640 [Betaproteobacteria bacterium]|nr:hypothetical protein [Betaproteobacteria bacterium]